ncbi:MAG: hypothetical protein CL392_07500 [Acidiferrobacteraceae bacterium]|nr:hypothetical protein [Acidiferrobacteraceae bacterium]MDP6412536.1 hypothetical protein [Arenicellales bacterium]|tara:strand:- start:1367 stop:1765 length:399 start_codon:yes stop_codon:yes gene_type:complete
MGRQTTQPFLSLPHNVLDHDSFRTLSPRATKLLIDIAAQYRGCNNGDLCAPLSVMRKRGWKSNDQLFKARKELLDRGLILTSRQGGLNKCSLFALTWFQIDDCKGKLDTPSTDVAPHNWKLWSDPDDGLEGS